MLPTLGGRIQSRIFFTAVVGGIVTAIVALIIPATLHSNGFSADVPTKYRFQDAYVILLWTGVLGVGWECVYHLLMQWRWEKDWPTFFGFVTIVNEGLVVYFLADTGVLAGIVGRGSGLDHVVPLVFFLVQFGFVWLTVWLWVNGPMRVVNIRWRFFGGRLV